MYELRNIYADQKVLVTGAAGFIGFHLTNRLLTMGYQVVGIDNLNDYYDPQLKFARLKESGIVCNEFVWFKQYQSERWPKYRFVKMNLENKDRLIELCQIEQFDIIINLAAQAGVRYSIENPEAYIQSNIVGFSNILEASRQNKIRHLIYASSSSVYGMHAQMPFSEEQNVDLPISLYAASKKSNELMAHAYSSLYNLPTTGLRFFTVYGPWGRPDMAYFLFADAIQRGKPIKVFNNGKMERDFTYIDDIIEGIIGVICKEPSNSKTETTLKQTPYQIFNIGHNNPVKLLEFINTIAAAMGKTAEMEMLKMQPGDVFSTWANIDKLKRHCDYSPNTSIVEGVGKFVKWYKSFYS